MRAIKKSHFVFHPISYGTATLARIGVRTKSGRQLLLHYFPPHTAPTFHDHPWHFRTFILWGGYTDLSSCTHCKGYGVVTHPGSSTGRYPVPCSHCDEGIVADTLRAGSYRYRPALHRHRTIVKRRTFTIVLTGPKEREWCEGTPKNWVCDGDVEDFNETLGLVKV